VWSLLQRMNPGRRVSAVSSQADIFCGGGSGSDFESGTMDIKRIRYDDMMMINQ
jgi:hypothetical protein